MKKHLLTVLFAAALCVLCMVSAAAVTYTYDTGFENPVANGADPFVLYDDGIYYLYATNDGSNGYIAYTSTDLVNWHAEGYVLRKSDVQLDNANSHAGLWAPEVIKDGDTYYMVYTAQGHIGIAMAESPLGPFKDKSGWLFTSCKTIDGHFFRDDDGSIYLCDTKQKRILVLDQSYKLVRKYEGIRPLGENQEEDYMFLPTRIVVDASGNMYVLVQNEYQGIMQIDSDGRFISFVGGNKVTYDPVTKLWKKIMSKEQRAQLEQFLPVEYTNLSQDGEGLIYTVSKADNSDPIKRLNLSGKDVLIRNGYTDVIGDVLPAGTDEKTTGSLFVDIASDASGLIYALDANRGRIFVYNNEGFLFYVFGGIGTQLGTFATPSAIEVNGTDVLVADQGNPRITVFRRTAYAQMISEADEAYNTGRYDESVNIWNEVIKQNSNFELAYTQIGKVYLRRGQYKQAMDYFELGNFRGDKITNTTGYNKAFSEFRRETAAKWLGPAVITVVALAAGWWGWRFWGRKKKGTNRGEEA